MYTDEIDAYDMHVLKWLNKDEVRNEGSTQRTQGHDTGIRDGGGQDNVKRSECWISDRAVQQGKRKSQLLLLGGGHQSHYFLLVLLASYSKQLS